MAQPAISSGSDHTRSTADKEEEIKQRETLAKRVCTHHKTLPRVESRSLCLLYESVEFCMTAYKILNATGLEYTILNATGTYLV